MLLRITLALFCVLLANAQDWGNGGGFDGGNMGGDMGGGYGSFCFKVDLTGMFFRWWNERRRRHEWRRWI